MKSIELVMTGAGILLHQFRSPVAVAMMMVESLYQRGAQEYKQ